MRCELSMTCTDTNRTVHTSLLCPQCSALWWELHAAYAPLLEFGPCSDHCVLQKYDLVSALS